MSFEDQLKEFSEQVARLVPTMEQKQRITKAGAKVLEKKLRENTPVSNAKRVKEKHLKDYVMSQNTNVDGEVDGSSTVGFGKKAYIARFLNDGTVKMKATHFVDNTINEAKEEVLKANMAEYQKIIKENER